MLKRNEGNVKKVKGDNQYNGFTLAELLAVITVLAIIALIIFPIIKGVVSDSKRKAFEDSVYGLMKSIEMDYQNDDSFGDRSYSYENGKLVLTDLQGETMNQSIKVEGMIEDGVGEMYIDVKGNVSFMVYNDEWCAVKDSNDNKITVEKKTDSNCVPPTPLYCFEFDHETGTITDYYGAVYDEDFVWYWDDIWEPILIEEAKDEKCNKNVVIPSVIDGVKVKNIGYRSFENNDINSVVIPDSVIEIRDSAFEFNGNLSSVQFGHNVEYIGNSAFGVHHLTNIKIPSSVEKIESYAFSCYMHTEGINAIYEDESNMPSIGYRAFASGCYYG